jgi:hypothetical protein
MPGPPTVDGPISECNESVRARGLLIGAAVSIFLDETNIGGGTATFPVQVFPITAALTAGHKVHARQELGGEASPAVPDEGRTEVTPAPAGTSLPNVDGIVYECGSCLQTSSAVPGALVQVFVGSELRGAGTAVTGRARIRLSPVTSHGDILQVRQVACGVAGDSLPVPAEAAPASPNVRLPRPELTDLRACDREIAVTNVVPGARVIAVRSSGPTHNDCTTEQELRIRATPELQENETVTAHHEFPECGIASDSTERTVAPATPVPVPSIVPPLCAGATRIKVQGLRVGATVHISVDGIRLGPWGVSDPTEVCQLPDDALSPGSSVTAAQTVCGILSEESDAIVVASAPSSVDTPIISGPLHACAPLVKVIELTPGAQVVIRDRVTGAPRSDSVLVSDDVAVIDVSPALMPGETIFASADSCGVHRESDPVTVEEVLTQFRPPGIRSPAIAGREVLAVRDAIPGATVDVSLNDVWTYSDVASQAEMTFKVNPLVLGTELRCRQRLCSTVSEVSGRVVVRAPGPRITTESPLPDGEVGAFYSAGIEVTGGVAPLEWFRSSGVVPSGLSLNSTNGVLSGTPEIAGDFEVTVEVRDSGSPSLSDERSFDIRTRGPEEVSIDLVREAVLGPVGYRAEFPSFGTARGRLLRIRVPLIGLFEDLAVLFVRHGHSTAECGDSAAIVVIGENQSTTPEELESIFGVSEPEFDTLHHIVFVACVATTTPLPDRIPIEITVLFD